MPRLPFTRTIQTTMLLLCGAAALSGCGSDKEAELQRQLDEARQQTAEAEAARSQAEAQAAKARSASNDASLASFYGGDDASAQDQGDQPDQSDPGGENGGGGGMDNGPALTGPDSDLPPPPPPG